MRIGNGDGAASGTFTEVLLNQSRSLTMTRPEISIPLYMRYKNFSYIYIYSGDGG